MTPKLIRDLLTDDRLVSENDGNSGWSIGSDTKSQESIEDSLFASRNVIEFCKVLGRTKGWNVKCFVDYPNDRHPFTNNSERQVYCVYEILSKHEYLEKEIREYDASQENTI